MSRTTGRTMELLGLLHAGRSWSSAELCDRLGVSERTLRRDIDDLRALGYGVAATRGLGGGYRLGRGAALPPLVLTADEATAVGIGLRIAAAAGVRGLDEAAARALTTLQLSLSNETRERIALVADAIVHLESRHEKVELDTIAEISGAIRDSRRLRIRYERADGEKRRRTVEPHRLVRTADRWYLVARDTGTGDWRTYRVDRLEVRSPLGGRFVPRAVPDEQTRRFASWSIGVAPYPVRATIRMRASIEDIRRHYPAEAARLTDLGDGTTRVDAGAPDAATLREWFDLPGVPWEHEAGTDVSAAAR